MTKIGVGVGEDFPVDEEPSQQTAQEDVSNDERFGCRGHHHHGHHSHAARRKAWHEFRRQMHEEWHARRRAFRDAFNRRDGVEAIHDRHLHHLIIGGLAMIGLAALFSVLQRRN